MKRSPIKSRVKNIAFKGRIDSGDKDSSDQCRHASKRVLPHLLRDLPSEVDKREPGEQRKAQGKYHWLPAWRSSGNLKVVLKNLGREAGYERVGKVKNS